jgi:hypothetical protein
MSEDILNQLRKKRNRSTVEPRQDALVPKVQFQAELERQNSPQKIISVTESDNNGVTPGDTLTELTSELERYPETRRHSAIVLEKDLDQELTRFCKELGITVEVFLEAAWTFAITDNVLLEKITVEAKRRYNQRKRVGQIKRLITMLNNSSKN